MPAVPASKGDDVIVELQDVTFAYGDCVILKGISLEVRRSEMFALIGASGSGTTTVLKICAGLLKPRSGRVTLSMARDKERQASIAFVFQRGGLLSNLGAYDNVALPLRYHRKL